MARKEGAAGKKETVCLIPIDVRFNVDVDAFFGGTEMSCDVGERPNSSSSDVTQPQNSADCDISTWMTLAFNRCL